MHKKIKRAVGTVLLTATLAATACGSSEEPSAGGDVSVWVTSGTDGVLKSSQERWNAESDSKIDIQFFETDPYKSKLRTAISAGEGPTVFHNWGGGGLKQYVDAGEVESLQAAFDADPEAKDRIFPSVLEGATIDGEIYGTPYNGVQPVVIYYNKSVFEQAGIAVPTTWDELLDAVSVFNEQGIAPFSIGGASRWPYRMWLAYLTDRIGGPEVFQRIEAGEAGAWEDPAVVQAATMIQDLVDAGGFVDGFASVDANQGLPRRSSTRGRRPCSSRARGPTRVPISRGLRSSSMAASSAGPPSRPSMAASETPATSAETSPPSSRSVPRRRRRTGRAPPTGS